VTIDFPLQKGAGGFGRRWNVMEPLPTRITFRTKPQRGDRIHKAAAANETAAATVKIIE